MTGVNEDTDFSSVPTCELGHVLRDIVRRILYLRQRFGRGARIVLSKMDVKDAFRQVPVEITRAPVFGYVFGGLVLVDRRLQFGWRNSTVVQVFGVCLRRRKSMPTVTPPIVVQCAPTAVARRHGTLL